MTATAGGTQVLRQCCLQVWGFEVTDDTGQSKKLFCSSQQECKDWWSFLNSQASQKVLITDRFSIDWDNMIGR